MTLKNLLKFKLRDHMFLQKALITSEKMIKQSLKTMQKY